jgi:hypothetical protein
MGSRRRVALQAGKGLCLPGAFKAAGLMVPECSMSRRRGIVGKASKLRCDTASITSRSLAWYVVESIRVGGTGTLERRGNVSRCAPVRWR